MQCLFEGWRPTFRGQQIGARLSAAILCVSLGPMQGSSAYAQDQQQGVGLPKNTINRPRAPEETYEARLSMLSHALKVPAASPESRILARQVIDILGLPPKAQLYRNISEYLDHDKFSANIRSNPRFAERLKIDPHYIDRLILRQDLSAAETRAVQHDVEEKVLPILEDYYAANLTNQDMVKLLEFLRTDSGHRYAEMQSLIDAKTSLVIFSIVESMLPRLAPKLEAIDKTVIAKFPLPVGINEIEENGG